MEVVSTIFVHVLLQEEVRTYAGQKRSIARPAVLYVLYMDGDFRIIDDYKCIQVLLGLDWVKSNVQLDLSTSLSWIWT